VVNSGEEEYMLIVWPPEARTLGSVEEIAVGFRPARHNQSSHRVVPHPTRGAGWPCEELDIEAIDQDSRVKHHRP
jgi:hypothetical protein